MAQARASARSDGRRGGRWAAGAVIWGLCWCTGACGLWCLLVLFGALFEVLVTVRVHVCKIDGAGAWVLVQVLFQGRGLLVTGACACLVTAHEHLCEIDGMLGGMQFGFGGAVRGAGVQSSAWFFAIRGLCRCNEALYRPPHSPDETRH